MNVRTSHLLLGTPISVIATALLIGCNKAPEAAPAAPEPPITVGTQVDDAGITASVKSALLADPGTKDLGISVVTFKGEVQLTGFVNNQGQIDQATQIARAAEGASSVKNELIIKQ
jgi:hyperosmotically inducible periplasmic protein